MTKSPNIWKSEKLDIIFVEGFHDFISKRPEILKIITAKDPVDLEKTLKETVPPILAIAGLIAKENPQTGGIPYIDLPRDKERLLEIVKSHLKPSKEKIR